MKKENDANGKSNASDCRPCAMLGAGNLAASLWKFGDEETGWRYRFNIFRMSRANGRVSHRLLPQDVADLAKLAQTLAFALSEEECLDRELRDDLGCLFTCLADVLPSTPDTASRHPRVSDAVVTLLRTVLCRFVHTEEQHFGANPFADHSYRLMLLIDRWLEGVIPPEGAALPDVDFDVSA